MTFGTFAALYKPVSGPTGFMHLTALHTSGGTWRCAFGYHGTDDKAGVHNNTAFSSSPTASLDDDRWHVVVYRKATGSATGRYSIYDYTAAAWGHADGSAAIGNWTSPGASGTVRMSFESGSEFFQGRVAVIGIWADEVHWSADTTGDAAIEAAGLEDALQKWVDEAPDVLWRFNQSSTSEAVNDLINNADQSSITGTTVITTDGPDPFNWTLGGTTFNITPAGAVTPTGTLVKQANKALAGAVTPTGTLAKLVSKVLAGAVTPAGALAKQAQKVFAGNVTPTGALTLVKVVLRDFAGSITPTGALVKQANKVLAGSVTPAGALVKQDQKSLAGNITPTGSLQKFVSKFLGGSITPGGVVTLVKVVLRSFAGSITPTGTLTRQANKTLTGATTPTGALRKQDNKSLGGATTPTGSLAKQANKQLTGGVTPTGTLATLKLVVRAFAGAIAPTGTLRRETQKGLGGTVTPTGSMRRDVAITRGGTITPAGGLQKLVSKALSGVLASFGTLVTEIPSGIPLQIRVGQLRRRFDAALVKRGFKVSKTPSRRFDTQGLDRRYDTGDMERRYGTDDFRRDPGG